MSAVRVAGMDRDTMPVPLLHREDTSLKSARRSIAIASAALMLRYSFRMENVATVFETAIEKVLKRGVRTSELPGRKRPVTTSRMGDLIAAQIRKLLRSSKFREG